MRANENDKPDEHLPIVLGNKLINPYTVANMQSAFDYYNSVIPNSPFEGKNVQATHYYIEILPSTEQHLIFLDQLDDSDNENDPVLQDYPLDYEILEEGDYYVMPKDEKDLYHPAYTLIPVDYVFEENIPFKILDKIYEPTEEEYDVETVALFFANWQEDLEADEIFVTQETLPTYLNEIIINNGDVQGRSSRRYRPQGFVKVEDTDSTNNERMVPLQQAKISIGRNIFWRYTNTDNSGYFEAPKKYRGKVRIRAKWRGKTATVRKTWNEVLGLWVSDHLMTIKRTSNNSTKNIMYSEPHDGAFGIDLVGGHLWYKATVYNGFILYNGFAQNNGISETVRRANTWVWANGSASSTPMLKRYPLLPLMTQYANIGQANLWNVIVTVAGSRAIQILPWHLRPDFIQAGLKNKKNRQGQSGTHLIHQTVFHESGHFSHALKAGADFWAQVFASEMSNALLHGGDPYVDGSYPSFTAGRRITLAEGWGNLCEFKITTAVYGSAQMSSINGNANFTAGDINFNMESFNKYDVPMSSQRFDDHSWFAHGVMWDVLDNVVDNTAISRRRSGNGFTIINGIIDNCFIGISSNANDLSSIFDSLNSNIETPTQFRDALISQYNADTTTQTQIRNLFNSYGY